MQRGNNWLEQYRSWEEDLCDAIAQIQAISHHEKNALQLYLETHPLPFQPSPVLMQLLQNDRRRRSNVPAASATLHKQQLKSADYLDRKFESEIRQHYELENAQNCGRWKQFHFQASEARRKLATGIERDFRQFCHQQGITPELQQKKLSEPNSQVPEERTNQGRETTTADTTSSNAALSIEDTLRLHLAQDWVHQERFNIQEAFTNQTKKLQEDLDAFLDQQEGDFLEQRQKVLDTASQRCSRPENELILVKHHRVKASAQFQSNTKRGMLLQTAPPLRVEPPEQGEGKFVQWRGATAATRVRSSSRRIRSYVDDTQDKLDELERRLQIRKEAAETKRKNGMQWIGRQCAHMFAQLDCKETESKVVAMLLEEELAHLGALRRRVSEIMGILESQCNQQCSMKGDALPRLPSSNSERRVQGQQQTP